VVPYWDFESGSGIIDPKGLHVVRELRIMVMIKYTASQQ
jgi:hypothetical protein